MPIVTGGETAVHVTPATGDLELRCDGTTLANGAAHATLGDRTVPETETVSTSADGDGLRVRYDGAASTTLRLDPAAGAVDLTLSVTNGTGESRAVGDLCPFAATETAFGPETQVYRHGYQSWSPTAAKPVDEDFPPVDPHNRPMLTDLAAPERTSHSHVTMRTGDAGLTMGFLAHDQFVDRFDYTVADGVGSLTAVCPGDGVSLAPGETISTPPLRIDATRPVDDALAAIADAVGERMEARVGDWTPTGWCSWYHYFTDVTAADVRENLRTLDDWGLPVEVVQLDDGYQQEFGDWRTLADGFEDMAGLVGDIRDADHTPGLWLAPFFVNESAPIASEHPEWFVTDGDGERVLAGERDGDMYGLDLTHPEAQTWLRETFRTIVDDWGFDYLKLDFLYAGALPGERFADVTRAEAYRRGMAIVRETVGQDTFVLGCGAPQGQSVGLVDSMRIGPDTAEFWMQEGRSGSEPAHENAVWNVTNRQWLHRSWWVNDPDCQLVREATDLTQTEREAFAALVALTGGANVVSDRIADIGPVGRELAERTVPPVETGQVEGVGHTEFPERVVCERPADGGRAVALYNWTDDPASRSLSLGADERGWDAWERAAIDAGGTVERPIEPHGCLLVHVAPASDHPHLLGTEHLAGLGERVSRVGWRADGDGGALTIALDVADPQGVAIAVPDGWHHPAAETGMLRTEIGPGPATIPFERA